MQKIIRLNKVYKLDNLPELINNSFIYEGKIGLTGSIFSRPVINSLGIYKHYALVYGFDKNDILWMIEHNINGVECITFEDFLNGQKKFKVENYVSNPLYSKIILSRAKTKVGSIYDQSNFNCEHFVNFTHSGIEYSKQATVTKNILDLAIMYFELRVSIATKDQELLDSINKTRKILNIERSSEFDDSLKKIIKKERD